MSAAEAAAGGFLILCATRVPLQHRGHGGGSRGAQCALYYTSPMARRDLAHFRNNNSVLKCGGKGPTTPFILQRNVADVFSWLVKLICFDCGCLHKFHWLERSKISYWFSKAPFLTGYISSYIQITLLPRITPCCIQVNLPDPTSLFAISIKTSKDLLSMYSLCCRGILEDFFLLKH